jgi:LuxR family maltose regulon positive regulatory protein
VETVDKSPPPLFRHHVRRPRLTQLLDESGAQAIVLTAPAGYGKTTLAAEWLQRKSRVAWFRPVSASADVAAFSIGLCDAARGIISAGERLRQRLRVAEPPERAARQLAELLAADFAEWPSDAWLVLDDYHLVSNSASVEDFVDWLLALAPVRVIVTTRRRPAWTSARRLLYGEILEINQHHLAMTRAEAREVLAHHSTTSIHDLVDAAHGWPALIGLAAVSHSAEMPKSTLSDVLFRYFADEVVRQQPPAVQAFMVVASAPPRLTPSIVESVLRVGSPRDHLRRLRDEGLLHNSASGVMFHPLLRDFLRRRLEDIDPEGANALYERAIEHSRGNSEWDDAFELAVDTGRLDLAATIIGDAGPSLLAEGRLETVAKWFEAVGALALECPKAVLVWAESLTRLGRFSEAEALIEPVVASLGHDDADASRAWYLLGHARHLTSDYGSAVSCQQRARLHARTPHEEARAAWGALISAAELEPPDLQDYLAEFERLACDDVDSRLRVACGRQLAAEHCGTLAGTWDALRCSLTLTPFASDPMAVSNALANASCLNIARSEYGLALRLATDALDFCSRLGLSFAVGYCLAYRGGAEIGMRNFAAAQRSLAELTRVLEDGEDPHLLLERAILSLKLTLASDTAEERTESLPLSDGRMSRLPRASHGKYLALESLACARVGLTTDAREKARTAGQMTLSPEARSLARFAEIVAGVADESSPEDVRQLAVATFRDAEMRECLDSVVVACRAYRPVVDLLSGDREVRRRLERLLERSNDRSLLNGVRTTNGGGEHGHGGLRLTRREREVIELVAAGLTTREIAGRLFITESTAKVHIHHIFEKMGVRSRVQAALMWSSRQTETTQLEQAS